MKTLIAVFLVLATVTACGFVPERLEAFNVVLVPQDDCVTGAVGAVCIDPALLSQRETRARWILEHAEGDSFLVTTHEGATLGGVLFADDGTVLDEGPCLGGGGLCYFARTRAESTDERNNGCTTFSDFTIIMRRSQQESIEAIVVETSGTDEDCGAPTVLQATHRVSGTLANDAAQSRERDLEE